MIDKEHIEKAAKKYAAGEITKSRVERATHAFSVGAEWRINSVWHDAETTPKENSKIVLIDKYGDWYNISYSFDEYDDAFGKGWESCVREYEIDKWAYINDLLPTKGGAE